MRFLIKCGIYLIIFLLILTTMWKFLIGESMFTTLFG